MVYKDQDSEDGIENTATRESSVHEDTYSNDSDNSSDAALKEEDDSDLDMEAKTEENSMMSYIKDENSTVTSVVNEISEIAEEAEHAEDIEEFDNSRFVEDLLNNSEQNSRTILRESMVNTNEPVEGGNDQEGSTRSSSFDPDQDLSQIVRDVEQIQQDNANVMSLLDSEPILNVLNSEDNQVENVLAFMDNTASFVADAPIAEVSVLPELSMDGLNDISAPASVAEHMEVASEVHQEEQTPMPEGEDMVIDAAPVVNESEVAVEEVVEVSVEPIAQEVESAAITEEVNSEPIANGVDVAESVVETTEIMQDVSEQMDTDEAPAPESTLTVEQEQETPIEVEIQAEIATVTTDQIEIERIEAVVTETEVEVVQTVIMHQNIQPIVAVAEIPEPTFRLAIEQIVQPIAVASAIDQSDAIVAETVEQTEVEIEAIAEPEEAAVEEEIVEIPGPDFQEMLDKETDLLHREIENKINNASSLTTTPVKGNGKFNNEIQKDEIIMGPRVKQLGNVFKYALESCLDNCGDSQFASAFPNVKDAAQLSKLNDSRAKLVGFIRENMNYQFDKINQEREIPYKLNLLDNLVVKARERNQELETQKRRLSNQDEASSGDKENDTVDNDNNKKIKSSDSNKEPSVGQIRRVMPEELVRAFRMDAKRGEIELLKESLRDIERVTQQQLSHLKGLRANMNIFKEEISNSIKRIVPDSELLDKIEQISS